MLGCLSLWIPAVFSGESPTWDRFRAAKDSGSVPILPDYSYAGYGLGEHSIPSSQGPIFEVTAYGAVPDDGENDRAAIEETIRAAEAAGGGIVFFPPGLFRVNEEPGLSRSIAIHEDNIILRGSGSGPGGTVLFMKEPMLPTDPDKKWTTPNLFSFVLTEEKNQRPVITRISADSQRESFSITVEDSDRLEVGMFVILEMRDPGANEVFLDGREPWSIWTTTVEQGVNVRGEKHRITAIEGNRIEFAEPIHCPIDADLGWNVRRAPMGHGWGVEDIHFKGNFHDKFVHHLDARHDSGWSILGLARGHFPYVRGCRFSDVSAAVSLSACYGATILNCSIEGKQGHSSFAANYFSYGTLMAFCHDVVAEGAFHGYGANAGAVGTVIYRSKNSNRGFDWHGSFPYATLIDACWGGLIGNGGNVKNLPNHMRHLTFWNFEQTAGTVYNEYDWWSARQGDEYYSGAKVVNPILIGFHGLSTTFRQDHCGIIESHGSAVEPDSLFEAQLQLRLGRLPDWIAQAREQSRFFEQNGYFRIQHD